MSSPTNTQQLAIAARGNVLVSAGAGTGKTSTLVQRCISLLAEGCSLENILMVTFTEAAAVEMRGRIREALIEKCRVAGDECLEAAAADAGHFEQQLALLDTALISTLHGFCLQLVREHFYELGIDPDVMVLDEQQTQPLIQQSLDSILERHYASNTTESRSVRSLIRAQGSDENLRKLVLKLHRYSQARDNPRGWLEKQRAMFNETEPRQWREWMVENFPAWRESWLPELKAFAGTQAVDLSIAALQKVSATFDEVAEALQGIRAADDEENWPRGSRTKVRKPLEAFFKEAAFLASLTPKNGTNPLSEDWEFVRKDMLALVELTEEFTATFSQAKRELGGVDFADIEQFALQVLRNPQTAAQWQQRLEYIFVDEYQDINAAQDAILSALSRSGAAANRFLVGDVKQSIYRFRLADPTIFRTYEKHWSDGLQDSQRIALSDNFRSREGILDFINALFSTLMHEDVGGVAYERLNFGNAAERGALAKRSDPRVELHLICKSDEPNGEAARDDNGSENGSTNVADLLATEREARLVALRLRELKEQAHEVWDKNEKRLRPVQWSDMAVLLRSPSSRVEGFAKEFAACGVPLEAARGGFFESIEVSDLISLLKLLDNPLQDIPFLAVLRSPLVGMSLSELAEIRASEPLDDRAKFFWSAAQKFHQQKSDSSAWKKLDVFFAQLIRWRELIRQTSLSNCLETALDETQYEALLRAGPRGEQQLGNIHRLLDLAREYDPYQRQGLFRFLRFVEMQSELQTELSAAPSESDAVQLISIHRSKGLEFPVVALAGIGWGFNFQDLRENILLDERFGLCPKITPPDGEGRYPSLSYWLAARHQRAELLGEELRLLYVAMTRARDTLLLVGASGKKGEPWDTEASEFNDRALLSAHCYLDWLKLWLPGITCDGDWSGDGEGQNKLLRWHIYSEEDARLALTDGIAVPQELGDKTQFEIDPAVLERMNWRYPFTAATEQRAKTSVTELRRSREEEESTRARFLERSPFHLSAPKKRTALSAAAIGLAHHSFLQRVDLSKIGDVESLRSEAQRLKESYWLTDAECAALDFKALERFWRSPIGQKLSANAAAVKRELPFTARLTTADLAELELDTPATNGAAGTLPADEFVVVQGVADLVVILPDELWLLDFKTDDIWGKLVTEKTRIYTPQLKLYARALSQIYGKPVTNCWLYFLSPQTSVSIPV